MPKRGRAIVEHSCTMCTAEESCKWRRLQNEKVVCNACYLREWRVSDEMKKLAKKAKTFQETTGMQSIEQAVSVLIKTGMLSKRNRSMLTAGMK